MADKIIKALKIPDAIKDLPNFDGNPRLLFEFIDNVNELVKACQEANGTPYASIILRSIRNKIIGNANEILNMYGTPLDWDEIKNNLIIHYADKRNETSLIRDLHSIRQNNDTVEKFYSRIIEIYSSLTNHIRVHEMDQTIVKSKKSLFGEMCLNTFLSGLREPLGSTIRAMKPTTLSEGFNLCLKEQNISYFRYDSHNNSNNKNNSNNN